MKLKKEKLLMAATLVLCVLLFLERLTGQIWHAVFGLALVVIVAVHCCRTKKTMKYRKTSFKAVDILLIVVLALLVITGVLAHPLHDVMAVKIVHKLCAVLFVIGIIVHAAQHGKLKKKKA